MRYLILQDPGHNKVYYKESKKLCIAELELGLESIGYNLKYPLFV